MTEGGREMRAGGQRCMLGGLDVRDALGRSYSRLIQQSDKWISLDIPK
jgi:hypothetical protein